MDSLPTLVPMFYVYLIRSIEYPDRTYVGFSTDLKKRFRAHNAGQSIRTASSNPAVRWDNEPYRLAVLEQELTELIADLVGGAMNGGCADAWQAMKTYTR